MSGSTQAQCLLRSGITPFENKERFEDNFPADFISEGVDQTRGWFYTLHAIATLVIVMIKPTRT